MGKQVGFFMLAEDEQSFAEVVLAPRCVVLLPVVGDSEIVTEYRSLSEVERTKYPRVFFIWNKAVGNSPRMNNFGPSNVRVDTSNSSVIEFARSFFHQQTLVAGRLWAEMYSLDEGRRELAYKGKDFERWYDSLARWIRRHYKREKKYGIFIGPNAQKAVERGEIQLAQHLTVHGPI